MSESSTKHAGRSLRTKPNKKCNSSPSTAHARASSNQRISNGRGRDAHLSPFSGDSDDEYDRSNVVFKSDGKSAERGDHESDLLRAGASGTRVKSLWKDIKDEEDDGRRHKSAQCKSARARKSKSPPAPRSIQKRTDGTSTSPSPASLPSVSQLPIFIAAPSVDSHSDLLQRILKWDEELKASNFNDTMPPVPM